MMAKTFYGIAVTDDSTLTWNNTTVPPSGWPTLILWIIVQYRIEF